MAEFTLPISADGAVTAPTSTFRFIEPSAESVTYFDTGGMTSLEIPEFGWALADGVNPLRLVTRDAVFNAGGLAPDTAVSLQIFSGTQATVVGTYTGQVSAGDTLILGRPGKTFLVTFAANLSTDGSTATNYVLIGSGGTAEQDMDETYANLKKLIQGTGTHGVEYWNYNTFWGLPDDFQVNNRIEVSSLDNTTPTPGGTITFRYVDYGTVGNLSLCTESIGNFTFASAATVFSGGTDGTGVAAAAGTYRYFYTWSRNEDGAETGRSPIATITKTTNADVIVSALGASADTTFGYINVYRTTKSGVDFFLVTSLPRGGLTYIYDSLDDDSLVAQNAGVSYNELLFRSYAEGAVPRGRALAMFRGRLWTIGAHIAADYTKGTVSATITNATVTFSVKGVTERMVGRTFQVDGTKEEYTILSVAESGPTATLDREYEGTTDATATFTIRDDYDASRLRASVEFLWNQWPTADSPGRVSTDDMEGGTALLATKSRLFAFSKTSIISVTGDGPESWDINKVSSGVGCVAPNMVVGVEGGGVFLSHDGFYALSPDESVISLSSPKARKRDLAQGIDGTINRIAWDNVDQGYSVYDSVDRVVVFGLPLDGATTPNYEIVFDLQNGVWSLYKRANWTAMTEAVLPDGAKCLLAGDREGNLWHANVGESDGFYGTEAVNTLSGAQTVRVLTTTGTPFSTSGDGEAGKPVIVLYADGSTVAYGKVASNTSAALTLAEDLDTAPAASDQIILGGIGWQAKSGFATWGEEYRKKTLRSVTLRHAPATRGEYYVSFAVDGGSLRLCPVGTSIGDLTEGDGKITHKIQWPGDSHQLNVRGFKPGGRAILRGGVFDLIVRENGAM